ncbi:MAG: Cu(I)-responsive transcriptional regulator [Spirochaetia bacterium]|nr:Cu(I)-responsive transcriptional regulator [Spirochaetia bacterium]
MNIGQAAEASGISAKLIRHYESIGLISRALRRESGYRVYTESDVHILRFIKRARGLGFSLAEIKTLVNLWKNKSRASAQVKTLAMNHVQALETKIRELQEMAGTLKHLAKNCHGDGRPDCPILDDLEKGVVTGRA